MFIVYKLTNAINGKVYHGMHKTLDPNDGYMGSGRLLKLAIAKYGKSAFTKEILFQFDTRKEAADKERELVWIGTGSYNLKQGGVGGWDHISSEDHTKNSIRGGQSSRGCKHPPRSKEYRQKMSAACKRRATPEYRKRMSLAVSLAKRKQTCQPSLTSLAIG